MLTLFRDYFAGGICRDSRTGRTGRIFGVILVTLPIFLFANCSQDEINRVLLTGRATFPPEFRTSALGEVEPVANSTVRVLDLERAAGEDVVAESMTDADGNFALSIDPTDSAVVLVLGEVRVAGLADTRNGNVAKDFNGITDIGCEAGLRAVRAGVLTAADVDEQRIANLEAEAAVALSEIAVDFTDSDGSRTAAVLRTRELTSDGANPPA